MRRSAFLRETEFHLFGKKIDGNFEIKFPKQRISVADYLSWEKRSVFT